MRDVALSPLEEVLRRVDVDRPRFTYGERRCVPDAEWTELVGAGLVRRIEDAEWADCDACGDAEDVHFMTNAPAPYPYIWCRESGRIHIEPERLQTWAIDLARLAESLAAAFSCAGRVEELVPGRLWLAGRSVVSGRSREVFFGRQLARYDGASVVGGCGRFLAGVAPLVLVAGMVPEPSTWRGDPPCVLALPSFVTIEGGRLVADRAYLASALATSDPTSPGVPTSDPAACVFRDLGKSWLLEFEGLARCVEDSLGMRYLAELLRTPGVEVHSVRLRDVVACEEPRALGNAGEVLDMEALRQIKERLDANREDQDEARERRDFARVERLQEEAEFLRTEVTRATGLAGRSRRAADDHERARQAVAQAIRRALAAISREHAPLGRHLAQSIRTGTTLAYDPAPPRVWRM